MKCHAGADIIAATSWTSSPYKRDSVDVSREVNLADLPAEPGAESHLGLPFDFDLDPAVFRRVHVDRGLLAEQVPHLDLAAPRFDLLDPEPTLEIRDRVRGAARYDE